MMTEVDLMFNRLADFIIFEVSGLQADTAVAQSLHFFVMDITKIFFMLILVIYLMGLFRSFVSAEKVRNYVQGRAE